MEASVFLQGYATAIVKVRIYMSELFLKVLQELLFLIRKAKVAAGLSQTGQVLLFKSQLSLLDAAGCQELKLRLLSVEDS